MSAGPPPTFATTRAAALQVAPPSREVRATSVTPLGWVAGPGPCSRTMALGPPPTPPPKDMYTSVSVPSGRIIGWEFCVDAVLGVTRCVALQCRPWSPDQRTTCGTPVIWPLEPDRNAVQNT